MGPFTTEAGSCRFSLLLGLEHRLLGLITVVIGQNRPGGDSKDGTQQKNGAVHQQTCTDAIER